MISRMFGPAKAKNTRKSWRSRGPKRGRRRTGAGGGAGSFAGDDSDTCDDTDDNQDLLRVAPTMQRDLGSPLRWSGERLADRTPTVAVHEGVETNPLCGRPRPTCVITVGDM